VGSGVLAAHAVVQLGPWLVELGTSVPRWTVLAVVGGLLLLEGATYERQVSRLRAAAVRLASLR
jgi:Na+(H+)/acetate symporter ActP